MCPASLLGAASEATIIFQSDKNILLIRYIPDRESTSFCCVV